MKQRRNSKTMLQDAWSSFWIRVASVLTFLLFIEVVICIGCVTYYVWLNPVNSLAIRFGLSAIFFALMNMFLRRG